MGKYEVTQIEQYFMGKSGNPSGSFHHHLIAHAEVSQQSAIIGKIYAGLTVIFSHFGGVMQQSPANEQIHRYGILRAHEFTQRCNGNCMFYEAMNVVVMPAFCSRSFQKFAKILLIIEDFVQKTIEVFVFHLIYKAPKALRQKLRLKAAFGHKEAHIKFTFIRKTQILNAQLGLTFIIHYLRFDVHHIAGIKEFAGLGSVLPHISGGIAASIPYLDANEAAALSFAQFLFLGQIKSANLFVFMLMHVCYINVFFHNLSLYNAYFFVCCSSVLLHPDQVYTRGGKEFVIQFQSAFDAFFRVD